ncbi:YkvA family protein [Microbulbifer yueqingensis]|uniref:Uncharacterized membrane protein YkvA, DUF1232 family n=1 Tax=Microbulbifer yueqingensis TaxID=658219 RepID=A0A1G9DNY4_9GAMM|nr:YkvA family protein [Microbulbifer yueqingensis]SDK65581.1 Uncharacterized membrane protein YkvA, DUF1232 family [Microbulbifer yueqingensis]
MSRNSDFYVEMRRKVKDWAESDKAKESPWVEYILLVPDFFHLLCKLALDPDVPTRSKAKLAGAIAYFVSPIDFIPEAVLGPVGYIDDLALSAYVLNDIVNENPELAERHWAGEVELLATIREILEAADEMVGSGLWQKIKASIR